MQTYIALLRGINIGGRNRVPMPILKSCFEEIGFTSVRTYINSGNVVFQSEINDVLELITLCENIIKETFDLTIPVCVISASDLSDILNHIPEWWDIPSDKETVHQAIFLIPPMTPQKVYEAIGESRPQYEKVGHYKNAIFWSASKDTYSKTKWIKISSTSIYSKVTIRNANTTKKLLSLCNEI